MAIHRKMSADSAQAIHSRAPHMFASPLGLLGFSSSRLVELLGNDLPVLLLRVPEHEGVVAADQGDHADQAAPFDRVVERLGDDVGRALGRVTKLLPLLL